MPEGQLRLLITHHTLCPSCLSCFVFEFLPDFLPGSTLHANDSLPLTLHWDGMQGMNYFAGGLYGGKTSNVVKMLEDLVEYTDRCC